MPFPQQENYTIDDIYALTEGTRAELIDGQIYYMAPPGRRHQKIAGKLFAAIAHYIDSKGGSCEPYIAPFAVFLNEDDRNYVEPDISVICDTSSSQIKAAMVLRTGSLKLFHRAAGEWTILSSCSNIGLPGYMNTGL